MVNKYKQLLSISEFARLCRTTRQTLIYYDKQDILSPNITNEKGYRFYTMDQLYSFFVIGFLKEMGVSLKEIKDYLHSRQKGKYLSLLENSLERVNRDISNLEKLKSKLENRIESTKEACNMNLKLDPWLEEYDEEYIILSDEVESTSEVILKNALSNFINKVIPEYDTGYPSGAYVSKNNLLESDFTKVSNYIVKTDEKLPSPRLMIKPKGLYASIVHFGDYYQTPESYVILMDFIKENNLKILGGAFEFEVDYWGTQESPNDFTTILTIQVEK